MGKREKTLSIQMFFIGGERRVRTKPRQAADLEQFSKMQKFFLGTKEKVALPDIDIKGYAKYVLRDGSNEKKRELLGCLKSKICLANKKISLKND